MVRLSPVAKSPRVMVSVAVNGGFALLHSAGCIPGGSGGGRLAPDEAFFLSGEHEETSHEAILTGTRHVAPLSRLVGKEG